MTFEQSIDHTRPHELVPADSKDPRSWARLTYKYLDTGEFVQVPNAPYNCTPQLRAQQCRHEAGRCMQRAQAAKADPLLSQRNKDYEVNRSTALANELLERAATYEDEARAMRFGVFNSAMPQPDNINMPRTVCAWLEYLANEAPLIKMLFAGFTTVEQFYAAEEAEKRALYTLQSAYYFDTSHINSRDNCRRLTLDDIARTAKRILARSH